MRRWARQVLNARHALVRLFRHNLRVRVALGIGLPLLLALGLVSLVHYWRERHLLEEQARLTAVQLGQLITGSLRHSMLVNDPYMLTSILRDIGARQTIERAQVTNLLGQVLVDSGPSPAGQVQRVVEPGCTTCHRLAPEARPTTALLPSSADRLRVAAPIDNEPACAACHPAEQVHLGILIVDVPLRLLWPHAVRDLQIDLAISAVLTLLMTGGVYLLVHGLVVRRVEAFRRPLAQYAASRFDVRLPVEASADEIGALGLAFNQMADKLERQAQREKEVSALRQRAIVEERERIARELHDGLAQVLGYVHTKATAVRLLLRKPDPQSAEQQLVQLEEAARGLFVDVREAILGLRMTGHSDVHLADMLREYAAHFSQLCELPVEVVVGSGLEALPLPPEAELQLLRIVQEALANARKHACASTVRVGLEDGDGTLKLTIRDDGRGFDPDHMAHNHRPHFGLSTMRERAEAIGAAFGVDSQPGAGTCVTVRMRVGER